ncbi:hypothetical protein WHR41_08922 [Cladosporium halotolerans]|uniref:Extracellular membrane protein CFEM domain-containing protein n=1 Tax=Cladosporium halotolerans TaxID=1052096 RepID=A0AB34KET1_9PEZI
MVFTLALIIFAILHTVTSHEDTPFCLETCLTEAKTTLCAPSALSDLTPCLTRLCPNQLATQNLIASLDVSVTPKAEYACQQAYGPSLDSEAEGSSVTLPLNGSCATSPYGFKSYLPQGVSRIRASNGCRIMVFSEVDCLGEAGGADVGELSNGQCVFRGGRSARLTCRNELDAAHAYIQASCGADDDEEAAETSSVSTSKTIYPSSAPYHGPGPTSSVSGSSTSIPFHWPFSTSTTASTSFTNTADTVGTSSANGTAMTSDLGSSNSTVASVTTVPSTPPQNGTNPQNVTFTPTLSATPTGTTSLTPSFTGLAASIGSQSGFGLGLVGAIFAFFL